MLKATLDNEETLKDFMGCMLSQSRHQLNIIEPSSKWSGEDVYQHLENGGDILKVSGLRALAHESEPNIVYVNGEMFKIPDELTDVALLMTSQDVICLKNSGEWLTQNSAVISLITDLINKGYWFIE